CYLLSPSCGWPLTLFLTPEGKPFYAATYIPKENRFGRIGLLEFIPRVKELWARERDSVLQSADSINAAIISSTIQLPGANMDSSFLDAAFQAFEQDFDPQHGGFGSNAKFPKPLNLLFLLRYWHRTGNEAALTMVEKTLTAMRQGSIYDHLGYGFHRYTIDPAWRVPHFEKMLYDQALLAMTYLEAYQATAKEKYAETAREILDYVVQSMTSEAGGFYTAESADSAGEEGRFYLWSATEIKKIMTPAEAATAARVFNITEEGNYIDPVTHEKTGKNLLFIGETDTAKIAGYETIRRKMLTARNSRPRPERDDKVLTDWNGLMIGALARGSRVLAQPQYGKAAERAAKFILHNLRAKEGKLLHRWRKGRAGLPATAADYSFMAWGLLELYGRDFDTYWLQQALDLTDVLIRNFWDDKLGGFYLTGNTEKSILPRIKESIDSSVPSSNAVAMFNLLKLSRLTGSPGFAERAEKTSIIASTSLKERPLSFPMLLGALDFALAPSQEVVVVGEKEAADTKEMFAVLNKNYFPNAVILFKPAGEESPQIEKYANFVEFMYAINNKATAYVCTNFKCNFPTTDPAEMIKSLSALSKNETKNDKQ
ncbi:MAG: thioredoxin domain-containing protein, partial [Deltaproteobacteria bacterium]|nr:thioredoxin domain-containing protein [Deltaproteobacteria bacterium]